MAISCKGQSPTHPNRHPNPQEALAQLETLLTCDAADLSTLAKVAGALPRELAIAVAAKRGGV